MPGTHLTPTSTSEAWEGFGLINNVSRVTDNSVAAQLPRATGLATAVYIQSWVEAKQRQRSLPGIVGIPPKSFSPRFFYVCPSRVVQNWRLESWPHKAIPET